MKEFFKENKLTLARLLLAIGILVAATVLKSYNEIASMVLYLISYVLGACLIVVKGIVDIFKDKRIGEKMLMTVASIGAIVIGEYFEAALIAILFEIGELIEDMAVTSSRNSLETLSEIRPNRARLMETGEMVISEYVEVGTVLEVLAGERIPLDGVVVDGIGSVDTSVITGESAPRSVRTGDEVFSGCLNLNSVLFIKVTRGYKQSAAQRIIDLSENALDKKTRNERFIRRFANIYTPIVILLALIIAVVPPLIDEMNFALWIYRACSLLAISCPCALVISVPLAYFCAIGYASKKGILIKSSSVIESLQGINTMAFDKTGTLTKSDLHVTKVEAIGSKSKIDVLKYVCTAELKSNHPIALAVAYEAKKLKLEIVEGSNYKEYAGKGVECDSPYGHIKAGTRTFVDATTGISSGTVFVSVDGEYVDQISEFRLYLDGDASVVANLVSSVNRSGAVFTDDKVDLEPICTYGNSGFDSRIVGIAWREGDLVVTLFGDYSVGVAPGEASLNTALTSDKRNRRERHSYVALIRVDRRS